MKTAVNSLITKLQNPYIHNLFNNIHKTDHTHGCTSLVLIALMQTTLGLYDAIIVVIRPLPVNTWKAHNIQTEKIPSHFCATSLTSLTEIALSCGYCLQTVLYGTGKDRKQRVVVNYKAHTYQDVSPTIRIGLHN